MKQDMEILPIKLARALAVAATGLDRRPGRRRIGAQDLLACIRQIGMVQLDSISVVSRAHETTLYSRLGPYDLNLWQALFSTGAITEYLAHAAAIVPVEDIPLMQQTMRRHRARADRFEGAPPQLAEELLAYIEQHGPVTSRQFEGASQGKGESWGSWYGHKPERAMLANLWAGGELLVSRRDPGFARWFDLAHRLCDMTFLDHPPKGDEQEKLALRALAALGITNAAWLCDYYRTGGHRYLSHQQAQAMLKSLASRGLCRQVGVDGVTGPVYVAASMEDRLRQLKLGQGLPSHTTFLSPFDNLIFTRARMRELFQFSYTLEIYLPAHKRQFGYYSMPILHRGELVGQMDPSLHRKRRLLSIRSLHLIPGLQPGKQLVAALGAALDAFAGFLGATHWQLDHSQPRELLPLLQPEGDTAIHTTDHQS